MSRERSAAAFHTGCRTWIRRLALVLGALVLGGVARADALAEAFRQPPASARPWVFWYWMHGAVSRAGITADLTAMKEAGIGGAYLFTIGPPNSPPEFTPVANPLTPEWWALVRHTATEADRLGVALGLDVGDGFATAGGPWITPELAMQKLVWSEAVVASGSSSPITLPQPETKEGYYRDIAVLAFPTPAGNGVSTRTVPVKVTTSLPDFDAQFLATGGEGSQQLRTDRPCWIEYAFAQPFTLRSLVVRQWDHNYAGVYHATRLKIEVSDDGKTFRPAGRLDAPRHGWQDWDADYTFAVPAVTARWFRFVHDPSDAEPGAEDLDGAKWKPRLILRGLVLSSAVRIPGFEGKSGAVWRQSAPATAAQLPPSACVARDQIVDLTAHLTPDGHLQWAPPAGNWTILRVGHTPTGHRNETAGAAKGLECDKFNPAAARLQFDHWFGAAIEQLGPELARRVLKVLHVDSWEAGSQNWSPVLRAEFTRRRGYDPVPFLPACAGFPIGDAAASERFLHDLRQTIAELTTENFFGTLRSLAHEHGCELSAETTAPTMTGDDLAHFAQVDLPMGEFWLRSPTHDKPNDIADAVSGAHLYGRPIVQAEGFTELRLQWDEHPGMLKTLGDHAFALGVNRLFLHVFAHNPWLDRKPGMTLNGVGTYLQRDQTWWPEARGWTDYLSRCQLLLQAGRPVVDIAYFTGEELPRRALLPDRRQPALPEGYAADSINPDALVRLAVLRDGRLRLPDGPAYAALVLPTDTAAASTAVDAKVKDAASVIVRAGESLAAHLERLRVRPDFLARERDGRPAQGIDWLHRTTEEAEIYFVSNQQAVARELRLSMREGGDTRPEIWDPLTGEISAAERLPASANNGGEESAHRVNIALRLEASGAQFVVLRRHRDPAAPALKPAREPIELVRVDGPWRVRFSAALGGPDAPVTFDVLSDWTTRPEPGIRCYSGPATYAKSIVVPEQSAGRRVWLDLGDVANVARVTVNGKDCGVAWTPPFRVDVTPALRAGANEVEIRVTNTWANRLIHDRGARDSLTWTTAPKDEKMTPLRAGLFGPVRVLTEK